MLVRLATELSGPDFLLQPGDEREFPQDEAIRLVAAGYAVPVEAGPPAERATKQNVKERRGGKRHVVSGKDDVGA